MPDPAEPLARECAVMTRYLTGLAADDYILAKYREGHRTIPYLAGSVAHPMDAALLRAAGRGGLGLRSADAYARLFCPGSALRQKLVLLLAILESSAATHEVLDSALEGDRAETFLALMGEVMLWGAVLALGVARFGPRQLALRMRGERWERAAEPAT